MKQTAVEWLVEQICGENTDQWQKEIEQAKAMEKEQIIEAFDIACEDSDRIGREYYNQTYE